MIRVARLRWGRRQRAGIGDPRPACRRGRLERSLDGGAVGGARSADRGSDDPGLRLEVAHGARGWRRAHARGRYSAGFRSRRRRRASIRGAGRRGSPRFADERATPCGPVPGRRARVVARSAASDFVYEPFAQWRVLRRRAWLRLRIGSTRISRSGPTLRLLARSSRWCGAPAARASARPFDGTDWERGSDHAQTALLSPTQVRARRCRSPGPPGRGGSADRRRHQARRDRSFVGMRPSQTAAGGWFGPSSSSSASSMGIPKAPVSAIDGLSRRA